MMLNDASRDQGVMFQSAPCTEVQGDRVLSPSLSLTLSRFNPLPAPKYREIPEQTARTGR